MVNFIFWMILLYDLVLGCFKLSIIFSMCILCLPCLVILMIKNRDTLAQGSNEGGEDGYGDANVNGNATQDLVRQKLHKKLNEN